MHHRSLPIANPCSESFAAMEDRGSQRLCDRCQESVHDLSSMTRVEAEYFLLRHQGQQICVRYQVRPDGAVHFRSPSARVGGPIVIALAGLMAACTGYIEEASLDSPEDGLTCEDAAGYTIPCMDSDAAIDRVEPEPEPVEPERTEPVEPSGLTDELERVEDGWTVDAQIVDHLVMPPSEDAEGCPLQRWEEVGGDDDYILMGRVLPEEHERAEARRIERDYRRELRQERRRARRARR